MTILKLLATAALALVAGWYVEGAKADEAYLCEANRIVYVKPGELELMKRTNACIAGYYGLKVADPSARLGETATPAPAPVSSAPVPVGPQPQAEGPRMGVRIVNSRESGRWFRPQN